MHFGNAERWARKVRCEFQKRWGHVYVAETEKKARRIGDLMLIIVKACREIEHVATHSRGYNLNEKKALRMTDEEIIAVFDAFRRVQDPIAFKLMEKVTTQ